jgi:hypothetical protein
MSDREPTIGDVLTELRQMRTDLMARMDRQQDTASQQSRDIGAILELLGGQQQAASDATLAAHGATRTAQSTATVATDLLKRVRQLESDVAALQAELRGKDPAA